MKPEKKEAAMPGRPSNQKPNPQGSVTMKSLAEKPPNPTNIFVDRGWRIRSPKATSPHPVAMHESADGKAVALMLQRQRSSGDVSCNRSALDYVATALREGRIYAAWVVRVHQREVLAHRELIEVVKALRDVTPRDGIYGAYDWLDAETLLPVNANNDDEF
jgi:hypothetical protein